MEDNKKDVKKKSCKAAGTRASKAFAGG